MQIDKEQSRLRWSEIRKLWNEWDPIGVEPFEGGPVDEYDTYVGQSLRLLEQGSNREAVEAYLLDIVGKRIGLGAPVSTTCDRQRSEIPCESGMRLVGQTRPPSGLPPNPSFKRTRQKRRAA